MALNHNHLQFWIPGEVPSSKNSKRVMPRGRRTKFGKLAPLVLSSKAVEQYKLATAGVWAGFSSAFRQEADLLQKPLRVNFHFKRGTKRKFDLINAAQLPQDMMVKYGWVEDDNMTILIPLFHPPEFVTPEEAGVLIWLQ